MASRVAVFAGDFRSIEGIAALQAKIAAIPEFVQDFLEPELEAAGDSLVHEIQAITPVAPEFERHPGELRDHVHRERGDTSLGVKVVSDARDEDGNFYAAHVEYGHNTKQGHHVGAKPSFWPAWQVNKKRIKARIGRAVTRAVKAATLSA